ncbi:MAG: PilN domain-containing protein [Thermoanaerobaculia bacterium]
MSAPRWQEPNLARAPFVNERPVRRLAVALWLLFAIVGGLGAWQSRASRQDAGTRMAELVRLSKESVNAREQAVTLESDLRSANLVAQNERAEFLNRRLAERSFSWSSLLETLAQTMPRGVRLMRLSPESFASEPRNSTAKAQVGKRTRVALRISGEAEETEALLEFVDRLYQHPAFEKPNLARESEKKDLKLQFELAVAYLPEVAGELAAMAAGGRPAPAADGARQTLAGTVGAASPGAPGGGPMPSVVPGAGSAGPASTLRGATGAGRPTSGANAGASFPEWKSGSSPAPADDPGSPENGGMPSRGSVPNGAGKLSAGGAGAQGGGEFTPVAGAPGSAVRPGAAAPPSGAPSGGGRFPENVLPTPLKPYASTTGGGR